MKQEPQSENYITVKKVEQEFTVSINKIINQ